MTGRVDDKTVAGVLDDHTRRIRALEGLDTGSSLPVILQIKVIPENTTIQTGDYKRSFWIDESMDGLSLVRVEMQVDDDSTSGAVTVQLRNVTGGNVDMLSTKITVDAFEFNSITAATPVVIDGANAQVDHGDTISIDVDGAGTGAKGMNIVVEFA